LKVLFAVLLISLPGSILHAQTKYALVIGNGNYTDIPKLNNPVNDANDIAKNLESLGFTVDKVLNGDLNQMEEAVILMQERLSVSSDSYGFFFFSGHGVQALGVNYLLPVDVNIPNESYLWNRALSMQAVLDALNNAGNKLNMVILDACRDNPFGWSRNISVSGSSPVARQTVEGSGSEQPLVREPQVRSISGGHSSVIRQPAGSIVVYATSAGEVASDGTGSNGLFTTHLLRNMTIPGLEVNEVFRRTGADVLQASGGQQIPAVYNQFFGTAYLRPPLPFSPQDNNSRLRTIGLSMGSSFTAPWIITTVRGTFAPFDYSFLELGIDVGLASGVEDVDFYSVCPFIRYAFFLPFSALSLNGWYIGTGGGYKLANYAFPEGDVRINSFVLDVFTGLTLFNFLDVSYSLRTNFSGVTNKISIGYIYRWK
jgi:hypothetical protein